MPQSKRWERLCGDDGSASLEFITAGVLLLVPLVYLVLALGSVQGTSLAVEGAARQAARVYVQSASVEDARAGSERAVRFALADFGAEEQRASITVTCSPHPDACLERRARVTVTVRAAAPLPLVPSVLGFRRNTSVPLESHAVQTVSRFWGGSR